MGLRPAPSLWLLAIPLMSFMKSHVFAKKKDYYQLLGVRHDFSNSDLQRAYHKAALQFHPDKNPGNEEKAKAQFVEVTNAYEELSDPYKRRRYDRKRGTLFETHRSGSEFSSYRYKKSHERYQMGNRQRVRHQGDADAEHRTFTEFADAFRMFHRLFYSSSSSTVGSRRHHQEQEDTERIFEQHRHPYDQRHVDDTEAAFEQHQRQRDQRESRSSRRTSRTRESFETRDTSKTNREISVGDYFFYDNPFKSDVRSKVVKLEKVTFRSSLRRHRQSTVWLVALFLPPKLPTGTVGHNTGNGRQRIDENASLQLRQFKQLAKIWRHLAAELQDVATVAAVDCSVNKAICLRIGRVHRDKLSRTEENPVGAWGDLQATVTLLSHLGSEEVRFTQVPASSSGEQVVRTATLLSIRENVSEVIGAQNITTNKDASEDQQYRAISSAYVRQLKHLVVKRIPRDSLATIRTVNDFRSFAARCNDGRDVCVLYFLPLHDRQPGTASSAVPSHFDDESAIDDPVRVPGFFKALAAYEANRIPGLVYGLMHPDADLRIFDVFAPHHYRRGKASRWSIWLKASLFAFFIPRMVPEVAFSNGPAHPAQDPGDQSETDLPDARTPESDFTESQNSDSDFFESDQLKPGLPDLLDRFQQAACQRSYEAQSLSPPHAATGEVWGISIPSEHHQESNEDDAQQDPTGAVVVSQYRGKSHVPRIKRFLQKMVYIHRRHLAAHMSAQRETQRQADLVPVLHKQDEARELLSRRGLSVLFFHQDAPLHGVGTLRTDAEVEVTSNPNVQARTHVHEDQGSCLSQHPGGGAVSAMAARKWRLMVTIATKYRKDPIRFMWVDDAFLPQLRQRVAEKRGARSSPLLLAFVRVTKNGLSTAACCDADLNVNNESEVLQEIVQEIDQALGGERFELWKPDETNRLERDLAG